MTATDREQLLDETQKNPPDVDSVGRVTFTPMGVKNNAGTIKPDPDATP
jgi:hypothetical protein